jgi:hypothetical protein
LNAHQVPEASPFHFLEENRNYFVTVIHTQVEHLSLTRTRPLSNQDQLVSVAKEHFTQNQ